MKRIITLVSLAIFCCSLAVFAGQNSNSSTTRPDNMSNGNMSNGNQSNGSMGRRRRVRKHRKHRRHRRAKVVHNHAITQ